jgi:uncharacterized protein (TIGR00725 family)
MIRRVQIGVMGSCADLQYTERVARQAEELGRRIAEKGAVLFFGAEKDCDSLSTAACRGAKSAGGLTVGVTYGKRKDIVEKDADVIIPTGMERGGGREFVLVLCCDAIITISGGSGTLNELAVAYQADIPMVALCGTGGWSDTVANTFLDGRNRRKIAAADTPEQAVDEAYRLALEYIEKYR